VNISVIDIRYSDLPVQSSTTKSDTLFNKQQNCVQLFNIHVYAKMLDGSLCVLIL